MKGPILTFTFRSYPWWMGFTQLITLINGVTYFTLLTTVFCWDIFVLCFFARILLLIFWTPTQQNNKRNHPKKSDDWTPYTLRWGKTSWVDTTKALIPKPFCRIQVFPSSAPTADGAVAILKMPPGGSTILVKQGENCWRRVFIWTN